MSIERIVCYSTYSDIDNLSDHLPVSTRLNVNLDICKHSTSHNTHINWGKVTKLNIDTYKLQLDINLKPLLFGLDVVYCTNLNCQNSGHQTQIQELFNGVINACVDAGSKAFPTMNTDNYKKSIPGWSMFVSEYKRKALFWHSLWKSNGSPKQGLIADLRRKTRMEYHRVVKCVKNNKDAFVANNLAKNLSEGDTNNFWKAIKNITKGRTVLPNCIDNCNTDVTISNLFANKYNQLYNSVSYKAEECLELMSDINANVRDRCLGNNCSGQHQFSVEDVAKSISDLKCNKIDTDGVHNSNHFILGTNTLTVLLTILFNCIIVHGYCPNQMQRSVVIPIPKNKKKSLNVSENYRGIALGSIAGKLFDILILHNSKQLLQSCDLQFGFKTDHSTMQCTFGLN